MERVMVRYKIKADKVSENEELIKNVFEELQRTAPAGFRYASFKLEDGVSFVHMASMETANGENPLPKTAAFKAFQAKLRERCEELPVAVDLTEVGSYRFFGS
jgi:hypothetical protein